MNIDVGSVAATVTAGSVGHGRALPTYIDNRKLLAKATGKDDEGDRSGEGATVCKCSSLFVRLKRSR